MTEQYPAMCIKYEPSLGSGGKEATIEVTADGKVVFRVNGAVPVGPDSIGMDGEIDTSLDKFRTMGQLQHYIDPFPLMAIVSAFTGKSTYRLEKVDSRPKAWRMFLVGATAEDPSVRLLPRPPSDCSVDMGLTLWAK